MKAHAQGDKRLKNLELIQEKKQRLEAQGGRYYPMKEPSRRFATNNHQKNKVDEWAAISNQITDYHKNQQ